VRPPASLRIIAAVGFAAALVGVTVAVGAGAMPMPLTARTTKATEASPGTQTQLSQSSAVMTTFAPHVANVSAASASLTPKPSHSGKATPRPSATPTATPSTASATSSPSASTSPTAAPNPTTSASGLVPAAIAENVTPTGTNQLAWSEAILTALDAPLTNANIISMGYWMQNEAGTPPYGMVGENNPINVSEPGYDGTNIKSEGNGWYLRSYPTVADGVAAIAAYLSFSNYADIKADLQAGVGLSSSSLASELSEYSGGGYTTIPDSWGSSQGQPET
jgi:hypothetical protein